MHESRVVNGGGLPRCARNDDWFYGQSRTLRRTPSLWEEARAAGYDGAPRQGRTLRFRIDICVICGYKAVGGYWHLNVRYASEIFSVSGILRVLVEESKYKDHVLTIHMDDVYKQIKVGDRLRAKAYFGEDSPSTHANDVTQYASWSSSNEEILEFVDIGHDPGRGYEAVFRARREGIAYVQVEYAPDDILDFTDMEKVKVK